MKTKIIVFFAFIAFTTMMVSCVNTEKKEEGKKEVITKKIMYDVSIVNEGIKTKEDFDRDWFWMNMPEADLNKLVSKLFDDVKSGTVTSYYYDALDNYENFKAIPKDKLVNCFEKEWSVFTYTEKAADGGDNTNAIAVNVPVEKSQIQQLRFLEEWYFENGEFCKRVIAVAPVFTYEVPGQSKAINLFYWVFLKDIK